MLRCCHLCVSRKVFLKHQVNWNTVCGAIQDLPWRNIWVAGNPFQVLNKHLSLLVGHYIQTMVIRVRNKLSLGLMTNEVVLLASSKKLFIDGPVIAIGLTVKSLSAVK